MADSGRWLPLFFFIGNSAFLKHKEKRINKTVDMLQSHNRMPVSKEMVKYYREAAETLDYESGEDFITPLAPDAKARVCARGGKKMVNFMDSDFAAVVISREHI